MLEESDKEQAELERKTRKAAKKVNQTRTRMGAGNCQPGIMDMFKSAGPKNNTSMTVLKSRVVNSMEESKSQGVAAHSLECSKKEDDTTGSSGPSNVFSVMLGQSNGSPSNVPVMGSCWGRMNIR